MEFLGKSAETPLPYEPLSPASCSISAILALIPHPGDPDPTSAESVVLRRSFAQKLARAALEKVETESDLVESNINPSQALLRERSYPNRLPLHPTTPTDLESIIALSLLSVYEYAQRGNLVKMRNRADQAYGMAMSMSLYALGPEEDVFSEARRRVWWMAVRKLLADICGSCG